MQEIRTEIGDLVCADLISAEADAIKEIISFITYKYSELEMTVEQMRGLYSAIFALEQLITSHAIHAAQLLDI